jgi:hypothetical protein
MDSPAESVLWTHGSPIKISVSFFDATPQVNPEKITDQLTFYSANRRTEQAKTRRKMRHQPAKSQRW